MNAYLRFDSESYAWVNDLNSNRNFIEGVINNLMNSAKHGYVVLSDIGEALGITENQMQPYMYMAGLTDSGNLNLKYKIRKQRLKNAFVIEFENLMFYNEHSKPWEI